MEKVSKKAPGIPDLTKIKSPTVSSDTTWTLNIQEHYAQKDGKHYDIRLSPQGSDEAYSWASRYPLPNPNQKVRVYEQPTHTRSYLGFQGRIPAPEYGAGSVKSILLTDVHILESSPNKILFNIYKGSDVQRYALIRTSSNEWVLSNYTTTTESKINKLIPDFKPKYKQADPNELHISKRHEVLAPKIDGAHNTIIIRPDKRLDVYSHRLSKNKKERIDHTYKTQLYKIKGPKELGTTIVRAELYIPKAPAEVTSGLLNSNTWKARETLKRHNTQIKSMVFDIETFKGKDVSKEPYSRKLEYLKEISKSIPELEMPELASTPQQKHRHHQEGSTGLC